MRRVQMAVDSMERSLGITFDNTEIIFQALTHPSASNENKKCLVDNQRLEFLVDSVLALVIKSPVPAVLALALGAHKYFAHSVAGAGRSKTRI